MKKETKISLLELLLQVVIIELEGNIKKTEMLTELINQLQVGDRE